MMKRLLKKTRYSRRGTVLLLATIALLLIVGVTALAVDGVVRVVKLGGFVQAAGDFEAIPAVINGCSDLMVEVFGDKGRHARSAVGVYKLPLGFAVEVDAIVEVKAEAAGRQLPGATLTFQGRGLFPDKTVEATATATKVELKLSQTIPSGRHIFAVRLTDKDGADGADPYFAVDVP